jgi:transposase
MIRWAGKNGPNTQSLISHVLESRPHPEQGFRSALGIMRLAKRYGPERLEAACGRALVIRGYSYKNVESILKHGLDQQALPADESGNKTRPVVHPNIRGKQYYAKGDCHAQRTDP